MSYVTSGQRRAANQLKADLREVSNQLSILNRRVGGKLEMRDVDLDCLDLIHRIGPLSASALSRESGLHPATLTGVLDRLEKTGWIVRERDPADRRAVRIRKLAARNRELLTLFSGMDSSLDEICADYDEAELTLISGFLRRAVSVSRKATEDLS